MTCQRQGREVCGHSRRDNRHKKYSPFEMPCERGDDETMRASRRFDQLFVAAHRDRFGRRSPQARQLTYDIAVEPEYESWRLWYDEQLSQLTDVQADGLARRLWLDEHFWPVTFELAAGAALRAAGLDVAYEAVFQEADSRLTPDWTVVASGGPLAFVEVHTDQPSKETFGQLRAWKALEERIAQIPVGVVLALMSRRGVAPRPPDSNNAKKIARILRQQLLGKPSTSYIEAEGYTFVVLADQWGSPLPSPNGLRAQFAAPSGVAGPVSAQRLVQGVESKVKKYAALAESHGVPLVVAVGSHRFTGVDLSHLDDLLAGRPTSTFQFNIGDTFIGAATINLANPPMWKMPSDLAGILWLDNQLPFSATARVNRAAYSLMPPALAGIPG